MKLYLTQLMVLLTVCGVAQPQTAASFRTQSYYGFSGLSFVPTAQTLPPNSLGLSYLAKPAKGADLDLEPFSLNSAYAPKIDGLEFAVTNTPLYASERQTGGVRIATGLPDADITLPVFPSVKYRIMPMTPDNSRVAMAVGFALPYGAYYVVDKYFASRVFDVTLHTGVGTKLTTYHAFAGATFTFGERRGDIGRDFPLEMLVEASWGGSLKQLAQKEEAFVAVSFRLAWTEALFMTTFLRIDSQPMFDGRFGFEPGPTRLAGIGLSYTLQR